MFDTPVTIIGNVLTAPEWRRTTNTGTMLVTFKVASTSRRYDRERRVWVDGNSLRVRVACWRKLGENVSLSVQLGDPVIVYGRIYSRDWTDEQGARRTSYELDAIAVGHDMSRGVGKFARRRVAGATDMVNDEVSAAAIGGEMTERVADPGRPEDLAPDHELFDNFDAAIFEVSDPHALAAPDEHDLDPDGPEESADEDGLDERELAGAGAGAGTGSRGRSRGASRSRARSAEPGA
ncbi:MAG TPA: single-stranded DNA-binding protein [Rugosimonospora sp.]|nr:single-stranded DNA-binding protein [Rugosimonospora sp.]